MAAEYPPPQAPNYNQFNTVELGQPQQQQQQQFNHSVTQQEQQPPLTSSGPGLSPINARPYSLSRTQSNTTSFAIADLVLRSLSVLCLIIALAVLASASQTVGGVTLDYSRSGSFKYALAVSIIGAIYSIYQTISAGFRIATGKLMLPGAASRYIAYIGDQIVVCFLLTGGAAAAAVIQDLKDLFNCTADTYRRFCNQSAGSVSMIFIAFCFVATTMTLSTFDLYKHKF